MSYVRSSNRGLEISHALIYLLHRHPFLRAKNGGKEKAGKMSLGLSSFSTQWSRALHHKLIAFMMRPKCGKESLWEGGSALDHFFSSQLSLRWKPSRPALTVRLRGCPSYRELKPWSRVWESRGNVTPVILKLNLFAMNTRLFSLYKTAKPGTL